MSKSGLIATVAFYGPNDQVATKAVVGILSAKAQKLQETRQWVSATVDVREDEKIRGEMVEFIRSRKVDHATAGENIVGCPHEAGVDHPLGVPCPMCDFWKNRGRTQKR